MKKEYTVFRWAEKDGLWFIEAKVLHVVTIKKTGCNSDLSKSISVSHLRHPAPDAPASSG